MKPERRFVFVGQGPNATAWEHGLASGRRISLTSQGAENETYAHEYAERYCARVALTGSIGKRIAKLLDMDCPTFFRRYERRNLNARFNGKKGKGDSFDRDEAAATARKIIAEGFTDFIVLGKECARAFDCGMEPLEEREFKATNRRFFLLPHPSGIVLWWNEPFNVFRARKRLREFLGVEDQTQEPK